MMVTRFKEWFMSLISDSLYRYITPSEWEELSRQAISQSDDIVAKLSTEIFIVMNTIKSMSSDIYLNSKFIKDEIELLGMFITLIYLIEEGADESALKMFNDLLPEHRIRFSNIIYNNDDYFLYWDGGDN